MQILFSRYMLWKYIQMLSRQLQHCKQRNAVTMAIWGKRERERVKSESVEAKRYKCVCDALEAHRKCTLCSHDNRHTRRTAGKQQQQIDRNDTRLTHEVQIVTHTALFSRSNSCSLLGNLFSHSLTPSFHLAHFYCYVCTFMSIMHFNITQMVHNMGQRTRGTRRKKY